MKNQKGFTIILIILIVVILLAIGAGVYYFGIKEKPAENKNNQNSENQISDPLSNWQTYRNEKYAFEFRYPKTLGNRSLFFVEGLIFSEDIFKGTMELDNDSDLVIFVIKKPAATPLAKYAQQAKTTCEKEAKALKLEAKCNLSQTSPNTFKLEKSGPAGEFIYETMIENENKFFIITYNSKRQDIITQAEQMLSTLKFIK